LTLTITPNVYLETILSSMFTLISWQMFTEDLNIYQVLHLDIAADMIYIVSNDM